MYVYVTFASYSYCFSLSSDSSDRMTSPMYSITMVYLSKLRAAFRPRPWIFDLNENIGLWLINVPFFMQETRKTKTYLDSKTLFLQSCFIFLYFELLECSNCLLYGQATSPATDVEDTNGLCTGRARWIDGKRKLQQWISPIFESIVSESIDTRQTFKYLYNRQFGQTEQIFATYVLGKYLYKWVAKRSEFDPFDHTACGYDTLTKPIPYLIQSSFKLLFGKGRKSK